MKDSRMLKEWLDSNGNQINLGSPATKSIPSNKPATTDFTEKFKKLYGHIDSVWGGLNIIRCAMHTLAIYYGYGQKWYHLIIRYIPTEGCFEVNLTERQPSGKLIYAGEADSWTELLDILMQTETIKNRKLCEWVDSNGNKSSTDKSTIDGQSTEVVYIWDMYIDPRDKGTWCSAEEYNGEYDGSVFKTKEAAFNEGKIHLYELEDEGELRGDPSDYDINVITIPKNKVSDYTLKFSGL